MSLTFMFNKRGTLSESKTEIVGVGGGGGSNLDPFIPSCSEFRARDLCHDSFSFKNLGHS